MNVDILDVLEADDVGLIELCSAKNKDGKDFYAFIRMDAASYRLYQDDLARGGALNLLQYGEVLYTGWGTQPDAATLSYVQSTFSQNHLVQEAVAEKREGSHSILSRNSRKEN